MTELAAARRPNGTSVVSMICYECHKEFLMRSCWRPCKRSFCSRACYTAYWHRVVPKNMATQKRKFVRSARGKIWAKKHGVRMKGKKKTLESRLAASEGLKRAIAEGRFNPVKNFGVRGLKPNKSEKCLKRILDKYFPKEFKLNVKGGLQIGRKVPDFVNVNGKKVLVEFFGAHWHGPKIKGHSEQVEERSRKACFAKYGFSTAIIWERDLRDVQKVVAKVKRAMR
jgi:hypothetical protein